MSVANGYQHDVAMVSHTLRLQKGKRLRRQGLRRRNSNYGRRLTAVTGIRHAIAQCGAYRYNFPLSTR